ncbi:OsmC family protein [Sphingomonas sp. 3-13AW]|jgi:organic hydroperoxide reductase OsmC/OhrA|uniref:OsmC family protein n=1 Tax=Sphingomonas sp. 3-13AW TaxID=3050450 RepID=UPI003BB70F06
MAGSEHRYRVSVEWTGNAGVGTLGYTQYRRDHVLTAYGKPPIPGSSDPHFRGDPERWNPEELLVGSLSACHQLWYLHLCAAAGIRVLAYRDDASGMMMENAEGSGAFTSVTLRPEVTIAAGDDADRARALHGEASRMCFIARSMAFPVHHEPVIVTG